MPIVDVMNALLISLSNDPRAGLSAGLYDAGEAIMNMNLLVSHRKPLGFYDPANPTERGADESKEELNDEVKLEGKKSSNKENDEDKPQSIEKAA